MLAHREIQVIGTTTPQRYKDIIEKDAVWQICFYPVQVSEPSIEETIKILAGSKGRYEEHHKIIYTEEAITSAAILATWYITKGYVPDKALNLLDETGARIVSRELFTWSPTLAKLEQYLREARIKMDEAMANEQFELATKLRNEADKLSEQVNELYHTWRLTQKEIIVDKEDIFETVAAMANIPVTEIENTGLHLDK